jgi:hypothetical protein
MSPYFSMALSQSRAELRQFHEEEQWSITKGQASSESKELPSPMSVERTKTFKRFTARYGTIMRNGSEMVKCLIA